MASGPRSGSPHLLTLALALALVAGCTAGVGDGGTTITDGATSTTASMVTSTTTTTTLRVTSTTELPAIDAEVGVPEGDGPFPAVVLVHGGAWVAGSPGSMRALARYLTDEGFLTVNAAYQLSDDAPGFPAALDDIACAVRYAAAHPDSDGTVAVIGHSAGAHLGAVVALTGDRYGDDCPVEGAGLPDRLVAIAGTYDVYRLGFLMVPFFGIGPADDPESWDAGNPQGLTDENTGLVSLIMIGELDGLVDDTFGADFSRALVDSGSDSILEVVEGARHLDLVDPGVVGALIATWLERQ
ncbi:MAG: alpha/beta hydrolase [Actinobacteria bacterium]|nr:alpha/beta hydrolase [Actinomycetota bacterium]MCI0544986.1 alpha/beta hydrolase [Actinomycetota bacterium]MCI0677413.1 alpha/beta hydrolase [Actinomycetota bacterium]